ncbi:MAG TPA: hypothetical protein VIJ39_09660 [Solirubrobacteraceae bacterium]
MSSPIMPFNGPPTPPGPPRPMTHTGDLAADPAAFQTELAGSRQALGDEPLQAGPPREVLDQIEAAGRISRQLRESGHEMRFSVEHGGRVKIELQDREGKTVRSLLASEALDVATGKQLS